MILQRRFGDLKVAGSKFAFMIFISNFFDLAGQILTDAGKIGQLFATATRSATLLASPPIVRAASR